MATIYSDGAGCCGRRILSGMGNATVASIRRDMHEFLRVERPDIEGRIVDRNGMNKVVEVVTADSTSNRAAVEAALIEVGFIQVAEWNNWRTGTLCRMFLYAPDWIAFPNGAEVRINPPVLPAPEPRPEPRIVLSTYHNVLQAGRSDAGWPTREAAAAAAPRAQRIDRRDVYASGVTRWHEGV